MSCNSNTPNINKTFIIKPSSGGSTLSACTSLYTNLIQSCSGDTTITMGTGVVTFNSNVNGINSFTANTIEANTYLSGGTNILDIVNGNDTFITGGTFNDVSDTLTLLRNDGASVVIGGLANYYVTGGTYNNSTGLITFDRNDTLSAFTVDLSTIDVNDTFVTGGTLTNAILTITRNDGVDIVVTGFSQTFTGNTSGTCIGDIYVSNIHSCSPLHINPNGEGNVYFGSNSGVTIDVTNSRIGIGTTTPTAQLEVNPSSSLSTHEVANIGSLQVRGNDTVFNRGAGDIPTNTSFGELSLDDNTSGYENTSFGYLSLTTNTDGYRNTAFGHRAMQLNTSGIRSAAFGNYALYANTTGDYNTAFGNETLKDNTTGGSNTGLGQRALFLNTTGSFNTGVGGGALAFSLTGSSNTTIGFNSLLSINGDNNIGIGYQAGRYFGTGADELTATTNSLFLGYQTRANTNDETNQIVIGYNTVGLGSNTTRIGNDSTTLTRLDGQLQLDDVPTGTSVNNLGIDASGNVIVGSDEGITGSGTLNYVPKFTPDGTTLGDSVIYDDGTNVGIGTTTPSEKLEVSGNTIISGTLNIGTIGSGTPVGNLGFDSNGQVVTGVTDSNTFVTGQTFSNTTYILSTTRNDGTTFNTDLSVLATDVYVVSGVYDVLTGVVTYTNSSGGTFQVSGFTTGMTDSYTTAANLNGETIEFDNNIQGSNLYNVSLSPVLSGKTDLTLFNSHTGDTNNPHQTSFSNLTSTAHTHSISEVINLQTELDGKTNNTDFVSHTGDTTIHFTKSSINLSDLGSSAHTHTISEVINLQTELDSKTNLTLFNTHTGDTNNPHQTSFNNLISTAHTHTLSEITDFNSYSGSVQTQLDSKLNITDFNSYSGSIQTQLATKIENGINSGGANEVFSGKSGNDLYFRTISGGSNTTITTINDIIKVDVSVPVDTNTFVTGFTFDDINTFTIGRNDGVNLTSSISVLSGITYYGDGSNLSGISTDNFYVTGGTFSSETLTLNRNDGNSVVVTGFTSGISGSGTTNYVPKFTPDGTTLGDSLIYDDGTNIGINTITPTAQFEVNPDSALNSRIVGKLGTFEVRGDGSVFNEKGSHLINGNLFFGDDVSNNATGVQNNGYGYQAGYFLTSGVRNNFFGYHTAFALTTGSDNTLFGHRAGRNLGSASQNTYFGTQAGYYTTGPGNTGVGYLAGFELTSGQYNTFLGYRAGRQISTGADHTTGTNSIFIGMDTSPLADGETNQIVIGHITDGLGSNTTRIGNDSTTLTRLDGQLQLDDVPTGTSINNLGIDASGNVIIGESYSDTYISGGTFLSETLTLNRNDGNSVIVTGFTSQPALNNGQIFVGDTGNTAQSVAMTGDVNIDNTGVTTIQPNSVTYDKIQDVSQASLLGSTITSGGTVEEIPFIEQYISDVTIQGYLSDTSNWTINGSYTGTTITGTFQGQSHYDDNYWYTAVNDNVWIRLIRG